MTDHPAKFPTEVIVALRELLRKYLPEGGLILDPFAGVGGVHELRSDKYRTLGVELEPEWAAAHPMTICGDATDLPFPDADAAADDIDAIVTSPPYGNRMADTYDGRDGSRRHTYRIALGRKLTEGSAAAMQWGAQYRKTMRAAHAEMWRVLTPGGFLFLNVKDHIRAGVTQGVPEWFLRDLRQCGFQVRGEYQIVTPGLLDGANREARVDHEWIFVLEKP